MHTEQTRGDVTKTRILDAAERLFATEGLDVSSRRISQEAGQKNNSAMQYHFASREALMEALVARRMTPINTRRRALLDALVARGDARSLPDLVAVLVVPLAEQAASLEHGRAYLGFLSQVFARGLVSTLLGPEHVANDAFLETLARLRVELVTIPDDVFAARIALMGEQLVHAISSAERTLDGLDTAARHAALVACAESIVDYVVGGLCGPVHGAAGRVFAVGATHETRSGRC